MPNVAHYQGDCTDLPEGMIYGPDTCGASYIAIGAEYDAGKDCTTLQFKPYMGEIVRGP